MPKAAALSLVARPKARSFKLEYKMATKKPMKKPVKRVRRFQEGGETADKMAGLAASNKDAPMGFFERLRMGNIDQEGSEAYNRLGAGRGRGERAALSELAGMTASNNAMPVKNAEDGTAQNVRIADAQGAREMDEEMYQRGRRAGEVVDSADRYRDYTPIAKPAAAAQNAALLAKKATPAASRPAAASSSANATDNLRKYSRKAAQAAANARAKTPASAPAAAPRNDASAIPGASASQAATAASSERERLPEVTGMSNLEKLIAGTGIAGGALGLAAKGRKMYKAKQAAQEASRAGAAKRAILKKQAEEAIDTNLLDEFQGLASAAAKKPKVAPKNVNPRSLTGSAREDAKADQFRRGIKELADKNLRERGNKYLFADEGMKRGGKVKKMASGGSVKSSTASKRGDGIALRGKTRGKIY
jgi:hypothetical protein